MNQLITHNSQLIILQNTHTTVLHQRFIKIIFVETIDMKKIIAVVFALNCLFCKAQINVKVGDKFIYNVEAGDTKYDFTIVVKSISPAFQFTYQMTNENETTGKVTMNAAAIANSNKMYNYFSGGDVVLKDMTSVLISRKSFNDLIKPRKQFYTMALKNMISKMMDKDQFTFLRNGKSEQADGIYVSDGNYIMTVLNDPKFPLIVSMDLGFRITLANYIPGLK